MKFFTSKLKSSADFYTQIALMAAIVALVAIIFEFLPLRFDVSEARLFSLSPVTRDMLKNLDDTISIRGYFTKDVPGYLITVRGQVKDMLKQYSAYGGGNVRVAFINPNENSKNQQEAESMGIPALQLNVYRKDKLEVAQGYMGVAVIYGDKREIIPVVQNISTLEYDLTAAIKKVLAEKQVVLGIAQLKDRTADSEDLRILRQLLGRRYSVELVDISEGALVPDYITTLIVAGARGEWGKRQLYVLDQFVMSGRSALFLVDGITIDNNLVSLKNESGVLDLLRSYGAKVNPDLAYDSRYNSIASFSLANSPFITLYGFWLNVPGESFSKTNPLVNKLESVMLPWVSSILVKEGEGVEVLAKTSKFSKIVSDPGDVSPNGAPEASGSGEYPVAVSISSPLSSYFTEEVPLEGNEKAGGTGFIGKTDKARLIAVSDSDMALDVFMNQNQFAGNAVFVQNLVDGLSLDPELATIRSKPVTERPIKNIDDTSRRLVKYSNIIGVSLLVIIFALIRFAWRRKGYQIEEI